MNNKKSTTLWSSFRSKPKSPTIKPDKDELKKRLTPIQYRVTQESHTERPFSGEYLKLKDNGMYSCVVCGVELFSSECKYESGCGWPAFYRSEDDNRLIFRPDLSHVGGNILLLAIKPDLVRTEVTCGHCGAHLGHLFDDGPKPTGLRYCINSAALKFRKSQSTNNISNNLTTMSPATEAMLPLSPTNIEVTSPNTVSNENGANIVTDSHVAKNNIELERSSRTSESKALELTLEPKKNHFRRIRSSSTPRTSSSSVSLRKVDRNVLDGVVKPSVKSDLKNDLKSDLKDEPKKKRSSSIFCRYFGRDRSEEKESSLNSQPHELLVTKDHDLATDIMSSSSSSLSTSHQYSTTVELKLKPKATTD